MQLPDGYIQPTGDADALYEVDGNAFAIIGHTARVLKQAGNPPAVVAAFREEAMSGDYDHVIQTALAYLDGESC